MTESGFPKVYESLPPGFVAATLDDFHFKGKVRVGMLFLLQQFESSGFEEYRVRSSLRGEEIVQFIQLKRIFVKRH